jgi:Alr-MurF fusion protein
MKIDSSDVARITNGKLTGLPDLPVSDIVTDSRQLCYTDGLLFVALKGNNHDGHRFIDNVFNKGIRIFLVEDLPLSVEKFPGSAFIKVKDTVKALQLLALEKRKAFKSPVIAVTGSTGKTIVKEWLADILGLTASVVRSPKSYNSQIGVPLSVWKLEEKYSLGIFEAGISFPGEMVKLQGVIHPDIGVITNIGDAHSENFKDNRSKISEKLKLFSDASVIVFCSDYKLIDEEIRKNEKLRSKRLIDWSFNSNGATVFIEHELLQHGYTRLKFNYCGKSYVFKIPFIDRASVENAVTAAVVCLALDIPVDIIRTGMESLVAVAMRMEIKNGINNCQLIEDYYNSDPGSLTMAVEFLKAQNKRKSTLILSDFLQSGRDEKDLYGEVAKLINKTGIDRFIGIGQALVRNSFLFDNTSRFYNSTDDFIRSFNSSEFNDETILIKGARVYEFEKIGNIIEQQIHQTVLEVSLDAISHNINEFRRMLKPGTRMMAMVKAFAYGAGPADIAALLEYQQVSYFAVACAGEGVDLRNAGVTLPIVVMNPDPAAAEILIKYSLEPEIFSFESLARFTDTASRHGLVSYPVHIKIDTGMHRLGFLPDDIFLLTEKIKKTECIKVSSVFSHLAASDDPSMDDFSHNQVKVFLKATEDIKSAVGYSFLRHILNSAGIARFSQYQFDMVRPGIGIYGVGNFDSIKLKTAERFKTRISQVKKIPAGEPVGYNCTDVSDKERIIAILPVGYADGLSRKLGRRNGNVFINGKRVPLIGNICMDMCMTDISDINAVTGDEAEIFGDNIPIEEVAEKCQTIPYEILTSIPLRVKRVFYRES